MSNLAETQKQTDMERLKKARAAILNATTVDDLQREIVELKYLLDEMQESSNTGEVEQTIQKITLKEIKRFWMHDATRADICKWVQTLICEINTQK